MMILAWLCRLTHQDVQMFDLKLSKYTSNFHSLEVVSRGSETQLQVGENLNDYISGLQVNIAYNG